MLLTLNCSCCEPVNQQKANSCGSVENTIEGLRRYQRLVEAGFLVVDETNEGSASIRANLAQAINELESALSKPDGQAHQVLETESVIRMLKAVATNATKVTVRPADDMLAVDDAVLWQALHPCPRAVISPQGLRDRLGYAAGSFSWLVPLLAESAASELQARNNAH